VNAYEREGKARAKCIAHFAREDGGKYFAIFVSLILRKPMETTAKDLFMFTIEPPFQKWGTNMRSTL
jgi:hypothetical protein